MITANKIRIKKDSTMPAYKSRMAFRAFITSLLLTVALNAYASTKTLTEIRLQLNWQHQFQFAGYYAAKEKGYYQQAGLDVSFIEGAPNINVTQEVLAGRADYGVGTSDVILSRYHGAPLVILGVIFQHSPLRLLTLSSSGLDRIHKLIGKRVMLESESAELSAFLQKEGLGNNQFTQVLLSAEPDDLISGKVDAMRVYATDQPYTLDSLNITYNQFDPQTAGIDFYGDNLFTTEQTLKRNTEQAEAFIAASMKGWQYAMTHQEELSQLIYNQYSNRHSLDHLRFEAKVISQLMQPDLIAPGYMNPKRWQKIADTYAALGLLPAQFNIKSSIYMLDSHPSQQKMVTSFFLFILMALSLLLLILRYNQQQKQVSYQKLLFQHSPTATIVIDKQAKILQWNLKASEIFGWTEAEATKRNITEQLVPLDTREQTTTILNNIKTKHVTIQAQYINLHKNGQHLLCDWVHSPILDKNEQIQYIISTVKNVTQNQQAQAQEEQFSYINRLTALPNKILLLDRLDQITAMSKRENKQFALMLIEFNNTTEYNDEISESLVKISAQRMQACIRSSDTLAHMSHKDFALLLSTDIHNAQDVQRVADAIRSTLANGIIINTRSFFIPYKIGAAIYPIDGVDSDSLIHHAHIAMYQDRPQP
jgi:PAS domain S-box-containing protein/diguanylate cyclase (GGDEF)-like protein